MRPHFAHTALVATSMWFMAYSAWAETPASSPATAPTSQSSNTKQVADGSAAKTPLAQEKAAIPRYTLAELTRLAREQYPGIKAARHALVGAKADQFRAKWAWLPTFNLTGFFAPVPEVRCIDANGNRDPTGLDCMRTSAALDASSFNIAGVFLKLEVQTSIPLYTFGKIAAARRAADAGVQVKEQDIRKTAAKVDKQVSEAYWGVKLAREILYTIKTGRKHLDKAINRIEEEIDEGEGENTLADLLRLKTSAAQVDTRTLEANKLEQLALDGLAALTGLPPGSFDVDTEIIGVVEHRLAPLQTYLAAARNYRPEVSMLQAAQSAAQAQVDLEKANFFPDIGLMGSASVAYASSIDDPQHGFYSDPFNGLGAGMGLGFRWGMSPLQQVGKYRKSKAILREVRAKQSEALIGITIEIRATYANQGEAINKLKITKRGEKLSKRWLVATSQNLAAGLSEPKDLTDALVNYFLMRLDYLKSVYAVNVGWAELNRVVGKAVKAKSGK